MVRNGGAMLRFDSNDCVISYFPGQDLWRLWSLALYCPKPQVPQALASLI